MATEIEQKILSSFMKSQLQYYVFSSDSNPYIDRIIANSRMNLNIFARCGFLCLLLDFYLLKQRII